MPLDQTLIDKALTNGIQLDIMSFIQIVDIADQPETQQILAGLYKESGVIVFTSQSAVYAVCEHPGFIKPDWKICCIANATKKAVLEYFDESSIICSAPDAHTLAANIASSNGIRNVVFFCSDKRQDTLPAMLHDAGIIVNEIIVYTTVEQPQFVAKDYDGILFYSPSGVSSYFSLNIADPGTTFFAIGNTTAQAIRQETDNKVIVCAAPSKEKLLDTAIQYFQTNTINT